MIEVTSLVSSSNITYQDSEQVLMALTLPLTWMSPQGVIGPASSDPLAGPSRHRAFMALVVG
jgi:hypothetical protein